MSLISTGSILLDSTFKCLINIKRGKKSANRFPENPPVNGPKNSRSSFLPYSTLHRPTGYQVRLTFLFLLADRFFAHIKIYNGDLCLFVRSCFAVWSRKSIDQEAFRPYFAFEPAEEFPSGSRGFPRTISNDSVGSLLTLVPSPNLALAIGSSLDLSVEHLKGQCHEIFCFCFFS